MVNNLNILSSQSTKSYHLLIQDSHQTYHTFLLKFLLLLTIIILLRIFILLKLFLLTISLILTIILLQTILDLLITLLLLRIIIISLSYPSGNFPSSANSSFSYNLSSNISPFAKNSVSSNKFTSFHI